MGTLEYLIISIISVFAVFSLLSVFFGKKKKSKDGENDKPSEKDQGNTVDESAAPQKHEGEKKKEDVPFKVIRKQSKVKISKKALSSGSRNPSVTKVFGKKVDEEEKTEEQIKQEPPKEEQPPVIQEKPQTEKKKPVVVERFGVKDYEYKETNTQTSFKIEAPDGSPNRSFELKSRSDFGSHLNVSEDGNLSGVVGIGIGKAINSVEDQLDEIENKSQKLIQNARSSLRLGDDLFDDEIFESRFRIGMQQEQQQNVSPKKEDVLKNVDIKTLIVAEAIANPKYKNVNKDTGEE